MQQVFLKISKKIDKIDFFFTNKIKHTTLQ